MNSHTTRKRLLVGLAMTAVILPVIAGCSSGGGGDAGGGSSDEPVVGFSAAILDNPFTSGLVQSIVDQAPEKGLDMLQPINAEGDAGKQVTDMQSLITQGVKGIVLIPRDSDAIVPAVEAANAADIPVVTVDTAANGGDVYMQVKADNIFMGNSACLEMGELLGGEGRVLEIGGYLATSNGLDRTNGFADCMEENYPDVEIVSQDAEWNAEKAAEIAQTSLSTEDFDGIYVASDSTYLSALESVMKGLDMWAPTGEANHKFIVTIDGGAGSLDAIRDGYVDAVISQPVDQYGIWGTQYLLDAINGVEVKVGPTDHDSEIIKLDDGSFADMLPSPTVTKDNVDDDSLWGNF